MFGSAGTSIGNSGPNGIGPMGPRPRWFNPHPIDKYATS